MLNLSAIAVNAWIILFCTAIVFLPSYLQGKSLLVQRMFGYIIFLINISTLDGISLLLHAGCITFEYFVICICTC